MFASVLKEGKVSVLGYNLKLLLVEVFGDLLEIQQKFRYTKQKLTFS